MNYDEMIKKTVEYLNENGEETNRIIEELDCWNGYLGDDRIFEMDEIDELYAGVAPSEVLARAFFGYDADTYHTDSYGRTEHGAFNPNRSYFYYNGYGNLISTDYKDYSDKIDDYLAGEIYENIIHLDIPDELQEIFDEYDRSREENDD